jgi:MFS family permease
MFLGWWMVALAFLTNFISVGFGFYSYGVFFKALAVEFGGSRFAVSAGLTSLQLCSALSAPLVGRLLDRGATRQVMTAGALLLGVGFALASQIGALWHFYLVFGVVMGVAVCMLGGLASSTLIANWFVAQRGAALGLAAMGISVSGVVMPLVGTFLIGLYGWRMTFLLYAAIALFTVAPAVFVWVVHRPEDVGQGPDGERPPEMQMHGAPLSAERELGVRAILGDRNFWIIGTVIALNFSALGALLTHAVPHATDLGWSPAEAALLLSAMAGAGAIGKPLFGVLTDRVDKRAAVLGAAGLQLVGVELLLHARSYPALLTAGAIFGFGMGGVVPLQGALVGAAFGRQAFGRVMGLLIPVMMPLNVIGSPLAGYVHDRTGSYALAFRVFAGMFALSMVVLAALRLPALEPGRAEPKPVTPPARAA